MDNKDLNLITDNKDLNLIMDNKVFHLITDTDSNKVQCPPIFMSIEQTMIVVSWL